MCAIITLVMLGLSLQNLIAQNWLTGLTQLIIALGFLLLLINNIYRVKIEKSGCDYQGCRITNWLSKYFTKGK